MKIEISDKVFKKFVLEYPEILSKVKVLSEPLQAYILEQSEYGYTLLENLHPHCTFSEEILIEHFTKRFNGNDWYSKTLYGIPKRFITLSMWRIIAGRSDIYIDGRKLRNDFPDDIILLLKLNHGISIKKLKNKI